MGEGDVEAVVRLWHEVKRVAHAHVPAERERPIEEDRRYFEDVVRREGELFVGCDAGEVVGFLGVRPGWVDRLYVRVDRQGSGVGSRLLQFAKERNPEGLELYTHQANGKARAFYEARGFEAVAFGVSPPPECEPDVRYAWSPPRS